MIELGEDVKIRKSQVINLEEVVLYNNTSGTNGTVTLSETSANFSYLEIYFYSTNANQRGFNKLDNPNGKTTSLAIVYSNPNVPGYIYFDERDVNISGTSITNRSSINAYFSSSAQSASNNNYIYITRVVGYR